MPKSGFWKLAALCLLIIAAALATPSVAGDGNADIVLGQANFTYYAANFPDARKLNSPQGVAIDASTTPNRLYVADVYNSRVLGWKDVTAFTNGAPADLVIGQPDLYSTACNSDTGGGNPTDDDLCNPYGVAVDAAGNLYVADYTNNRVLEYTTPFAGCSSFPCVGGSANMVFGQGGSFTSNTANKGGEPSANNLNSPWGVAVDANGNLYVADASNNRVLEYNTPLTLTSTPGSGDTTADIVFGQGGFGSNTLNDGGLGATSLYLPVGVAVDASGDLYVADSENNRVLEYNTPIAGCGGSFPCLGGAANMVFGQGGFGSKTPNNGGLSASSLNYPRGIAVDASGDLYIADFLNNRVLEYNTPLAGCGGSFPCVGGSANLVFGQGGIFGSAACNSDTGGGTPTANDLCKPWGVAADASGNLYVADTSNNRVLEYDTPLAPNITADVVLGQHDFLHNQPNFPDQSSLDNPSAVTIDTSGDASGAKPHLYVADPSNSRVLGWKDVTAFTNGAPADLVIGQPDPYTIACNSDTDGGNPTGDDLCNPYGVAVDAAGNLYVADASNNRVLEYTTPFAECASFPCVGGSANLVFGQGGSFTSTGCNSDTEGGNPTANDLCYPSGIAVDAAGNLYVADASNNRVLEYNAPLTNGASANMVFGQGGSFTSNTANKGGASKKSLSYPSGVAVDSTGNLYVADSNNSRVLEYNTPLTNVNGTTANMVFGQDGIFTWIGCNSHTTGSNPSAKNLCYPNSVAVDAAGNLWIADLGNNRVLEYNTPLTIGTTADRVFGQGDSFTSGGCNLGGTSASADSLCSPSAAAVDTTTGHLYIADTYNNRVLEYDDSLPAEPTSVSVTASFAFGSSPVGDTVSRTITVANIGTNPLFIGSVTSSDPTEYAVTGAGTCGAIPVTVPPKTSCTLGVAFTPNAAGSHSATLSVNDNTATSPQHVALSGTGTVDMTVTPTSYAFGDVKDGSKAIKAIVVHNYRSNLVSLREGFGGSNHGDFSITGGTCGATLAAKAACTLLVTFAPTAVGTESATMTVTDSPDSLGPYTVTFTASATIPESLSAKTLIFGNVVQTASKTLSITLTNNSSGGSITLTGPSFGGTNPTDFSISNSSSCGESLAAASSCTYAVTFTPSRETAESGTLSIGVAQDPNGGPPAVSLSGTGVTPLKVIPASLTFGTVKRGKTSAAKTITVTNSGGAGVPLSESITIIKGNSGDFAVTGGICGTSLGGGGASCTYLLTFTPSIVGAESATLGVRAVGDGASPHNVSLSGTGS